MTDSNQNGFAPRGAFGAAVPARAPGVNHPPQTTATTRDGGQTMTVPLATLAPGEAAEYVGCWCELTNKPGVLAIYEGSFLGGRVKIPTESFPLYADPEQIIIRPDLPRAWNPDGSPPKEQ
ncbi:hypothetical protein [Corynebacterium jeddahense]|uniref:Secreted protein n=1 Tax=Corynebacterium jeddahense TaxID=1414719 RepID=A0ABY7UGI5_9CORY|nr:hypothetical protein [Corynebacterium jeddahense]WCZ37839.1 hypothetical protein CJEDD_01060 [Corynebacterium jeddahense]